MFSLCAPYNPVQNLLQIKKGPRIQEPKLKVQESKAPRATRGQERDSSHSTCHQGEAG